MQPQPSEVTDYHIVSGKDAATIAAEVGRLIRDGWQPHGDLLVVTPIAGGPPPGFYQAMVRLL